MDLNWQTHLRSYQAVHHARDAYRRAFDAELFKMNQAQANAAVQAAQSSTVLKERRFIAILRNASYQ